MNPAEQAELRAAQDHEAAAVADADEATARVKKWEWRARLAEAEVKHLRALCTVLERTALPLLDPTAAPYPVEPQSAYIYDEMDLPGRMAALTGTEDGETS